MSSRPRSAGRPVTRACSIAVLLTIAACSRANSNATQAARPAAEATAPEPTSAPAHTAALAPRAEPTSAVVAPQAPVASSGAPATTAPAGLLRAVPPANTRWSEACTQALSAPSRDELAQSTVRWLLPPAPAMLARARLTVGPQWAAASIALDGHTIAIHASAAHMNPPDDVQLAHGDRVRGTGASFTQNEAIRVVTWFERGVSYSIDVECEDHENDARCTGVEYVRALAESLVEVPR